MKNLRLVILAVAVFVCVTAAPRLAAVERAQEGSDMQGLPSAEPEGPRPQMSGTWFVELAGAPLAESGDMTDSKQLIKLKQEKQTFRTEARRRGLRFQERYAFDRLWNGLSVQIDPGDLLALASVPGVTALYPVDPVAPPEEPLPQPPESGGAADLFTAITMTGASQVQAEGVTGAGVKVGVIDTGIDYRHPDLGSGFGEGYRVEGGLDFVGNHYLGPGTVPIPSPDPLDCIGHGTHVAGIIGANGTVTGVAPGVTFRAYKIFGCAGGTQTDVILAALEQAQADGVQVVNMSLGSPFQWPQYPTARASDNLVNKGVVVVASAGNEADTGLYAVGSPASGRKVIAVASVENAKVHAHAIRVAGGPAIGYLPVVNAQRPPLTGGALIKDVGHGCDSDRALFVGLMNKIAIARRGRCGIFEKISNIRHYGGVAVLISNDTSGIRISSFPSPGTSFPAATVSFEDGAYLAAKARFPTTIAWTNTFVDVPNMGGGTVSSFSSYGLTPDLDLKPDISAPGGLIYSTLPMNKGEYGLISGTSMASPHVAGTAALLLEALPHTSSQVVRDLLQNGSVPRFWFSSPLSGLLEPIQREGAGLVNIHTTLQAATRVLPGKLALGEMEGRAVTRRLTVENRSSSDLDLDLSREVALATKPHVFDVEVAAGTPGIEFSRNPLHLPAGGSASVDVTFTEPEILEEGGIFGGFLDLAPRDGSPMLRVPYAGMKGDYQKLVALNPDFTPFGNPLLSESLQIHEPRPIQIDPLVGGVARVLFHLEYSVRRVRFEVFDARTGRNYGRLLELGYFPRNFDSNFYYYINWAGRDPDFNQVPPGDYTLRLSIQKALGEDDNPAHWEIWSSPTVTLLH